MTVIIDYGAGNIKSVEKALLSLGQEVVITDDADTILNAERIILPGVGAFGNAMAKKGLKIPHMGWNSLHFAHNGKLFQGIEEGAYVYFVHSYYLEAEEESIVKASAEYGVHIHASVEKENVFACQFHPEKSGETGLKILKNFTEL